jgi:23S rRNA pseudouridine1911/1915/1917 synthase
MRMSDTNPISVTVPEEFANQRMDKVLSQLFNQYSRSQLQRWIKSGNVSVNGKQLKAKEKLYGGEEILLFAKQKEPLQDLPEKIPLECVYEDSHILVVNKPVGLVVHPGAGNRTATLLNALLFHDETFKLLPRAGIVHRLDKDTSGLMVVAKTLEAHQNLVRQLQQRTVKREYLALVQGNVISGGTIEGNIGRHPVDRKKMAVVPGGKHAVTHYRIEQRFSGYTLLRVQLETGRTHQIRVHMSWKMMPIVGDSTYMSRPRIPAKLPEEIRQALLHFPRQALHATRLGLIHPATGKEVSWEVPVPDDMQHLIEQIDEIES